MASFSDITARVRRMKIVIASPNTESTTMAITTKFQARPGFLALATRSVPELAAAEINPESVSRFSRFRSVRTSAAPW